jgi:hypothetical protein
MTSFIFAIRASRTGFAALGKLEIYPACLTESFTCHTEHPAMMRILSEHRQSIEDSGLAGKDLPARNAFTFRTYKVCR